MMLIMVVGFTFAIIIMGNPNTGATQQQQGSQSLEYNGYTFTPEQNYYTTTVDGVTKQFLYPPESTLDIGVPDGATTTLEGSPVFWVAFNPNTSDVQTAEVARYSLAFNLDKQVSTAITQPSPQYSAPVMTCANQTQAPMIQLVQGNFTQITVDNNCITVSGSGNELLRATERLVYELLGITA
jgi:hypothetical protein